MLNSISAAACCFLRIERIKVRGGLAGMVPDHDVDEMLMGEELTHSAEQQKMVRLPRLPSPCEKHAREGAPSRA